MRVTDVADMHLQRGHVNLEVTDATDTDILKRRGFLLERTVPLRAGVIEHFVPAHFESKHKSVEHMDPL